MPAFERTEQMLSRTRFYATGGFWLMVSAAVFLIVWLAWFLFGQIAISDGETISPAALLLRVIMAEGL